MHLKRVAITGQTVTLDREHAHNNLCKRANAVPSGPATTNPASGVLALRWWHS